MRTVSSRMSRLLAFGLIAAALVIPSASAAPASHSAYRQTAVPKPGPAPSGIYDLRASDIAAGVEDLSADSAPLAELNGTTITECPQVGLSSAGALPLSRLGPDLVAELSAASANTRANVDFSCFPQDETSIDVNPTQDSNIVAGANDYRLGTGSSGAYASTDGGRSWYNTIIPFPSAPAALSRGEGFVPSGGDPVIAFDRDGVVYYAQIAFFRGDDTNGVFVQRSTNGGFTWSRACVPVDTTPDNEEDDAAACGARGDVRQPGDGRVTFRADNDDEPNGSIPFDDKEWMTTGPRPRGVDPVCFTPITRQPTVCDRAVVGVDRIYVTWTRFTEDDSRIYMSYSDDQARSWSPAKEISGGAPFCIGGDGDCNFNQYSVPTVSPATGHMYVAFVNFNTQDEDQYLMVRSTNGGRTFEGPFFITPVFDVNFPRAGLTRPDCVDRGQQELRIVYTNSCFRSNPAGNIVADKRDGAFANDLYLVMSDNRNGTGASSNADIFLFKSNNGGATWIGPTRVNIDRSEPPPDRDCGREPGFLPDPDVAAVCGVGSFGNDQWWPWVDIGENGELNVTFADRRLDQDSLAHEWPDSRSRPGNYLVWRWGAQCQVSQANSRECLAPGARQIRQPTGPVNPGSGPQPGQGDRYVGTLSNFQISDVPSNYDYSFRAGIFAGDYDTVAVEEGRAHAMWTDARNGRSSRGQPGRNPICEQSDAFYQSYSATGATGLSATTNFTPFLVTPCPPMR